MSQKTHTLVKDPKISATRLADYMAASEQGKRSIATTCKYRPIARVIQHNEAKAVIAVWLTTGKHDTADLTAEADKIRNRMTTSVFDEDLNKHNADYIEAFIQAIIGGMGLPGDEIKPAAQLPSIFVGDVKVTFKPDFLLTRINNRNVAKIGAAFLRYKKNKETPENVKEWQSALSFGYLNESPISPEHEPEKQLCVTWDAFTGGVTPAPGKSAYMFKEITAACTALAERWPEIQAPKGAII